MSEKTPPLNAIMIMIAAMGINAEIHMKMDLRTSVINVIHFHAHIEHDSLVVLCG